MQHTHKKNPLLLQKGQDTKGGEERDSGEKDSMASSWRVTPGKRIKKHVFKWHSTDTSQ